MNAALSPNDRYAQQQLNLSQGDINAILRRYPVGLEVEIVKPSGLPVYRAVITGHVWNAQAGVMVTLDTDDPYRQLAELDSVRTLAAADAANEQWRNYPYEAPTELGLTCWLTVEDRDERRSLRSGRWHGYVFTVEDWREGERIIAWQPKLEPVIYTGPA